MSKKLASSSSSSSTSGGTCEVVCFCKKLPTTPIYFPLSFNKKTRKHHIREVSNIKDLYGYVAEFCELKPQTFFICPAETNFPSAARIGQEINYNDVDFTKGLLVFPEPENTKSITDKQRLEKVTNMSMKIPNSNEKLTFVYRISSTLAELFYLAGRAFYFHKHKQYPQNYENGVFNFHLSFTVNNSTHEHHIHKKIESTLYNLVSTYAKTKDTVTLYYKCVPAETPQTLPEKEEEVFLGNDVCSPTSPGYGPTSKEAEEAEEDSFEFPKEEEEEEVIEVKYVSRSSSSSSSPQASRKRSYASVDLLEENEKLKTKYMKLKETLKEKDQQIQILTQTLGQKMK